MMTFIQMKSPFIIVLTIFLAVTTSLSAIEYHVSPKGSDTNPGSASQPLKTIQAAADKAQAGDIITVHAGTYREWIDPPRGGESDDKRIIYRAVPGEKVEIKGSEQVTGWKKVNKNVWKVVLPNTFFGNFNPFAEMVHGDWFNPKGRKHHTGEVYLNGQSFYERDSLSEIMNPESIVSRRDPNGSTSVWYSEVTSEMTTIWANFDNTNPNKEMVEVNARRTCFYPTRKGINYLTISGFHFSQAATQWAAPTAEQIGMIATHWNKGWVIENNVISDAKCSGITLGKEQETGHNVWSKNPQKNGTIHYNEVIFKALKYGWDKANIGTHIVRNNEIYNCEQTGLCGSLGTIFCEITGNHIHHIWTKRQFDGWEIAGIKIHGAIDTHILNNRIHDVGRGIWLDWMAQGSRIGSNILYNNDLEDIYMEISHGPFLIDNNILMSPVNIHEVSEGGAFVHNLFIGKIHSWNDPNRFTPYHAPHSTEVVGVAPVKAGDYRFCNNIFIGNGKEDGLVPGFEFGLEGFGLKVYDNEKQEIWATGNIFCYGAQPYKGEKNSVIESAFNPHIKLEEKGTGLWLHFQLDGFNGKMPATQLVTTSSLGTTKLVEAKFENPDGSPLTIDKDYFGNKRMGNNPFPGPFGTINPDDTQVLVWK